MTQKKNNTAEPRYTVILDNRGNPDRDQDASRRLPGTLRKVVAVDDFPAASKACRDYIEENDLGGGNWTGGDIRENGKVVAKVSYNGTVWPPGGFAIGMKPLWPEPKEDAPNRRILSNGRRLRSRRPSGPFWSAGASGLAT
jgi:hypothetical protein